MRIRGQGTVRPNVPGSSLIISSYRNDTLICIEDLGRLFAEESRSFFLKGKISAARVALRCNAEAEYFDSGLQGHGEPVSTSAALRVQ